MEIIAILGNQIKNGLGIKAKVNTNHGLGPSMIKLRDDV